MVPSGSGRCTISYWLRPLAVESRAQAHPNRLELLEEAKAGHTETERMWHESTRWLLHPLVERPI
jgi:hypothetical protein